MTREQHTTTASPPEQRVREPDAKRSRQETARGHARARAEAFKVAGEAIAKLERPADRERVIEALWIAIARPSKQRGRRAHVARSA